MATLERGVKLPARLLLPADARPRFGCEVCGTSFFEEPSFVRHVARCVRKNRDAIEKLVDDNHHRDPLHGATDWEALDWQLRRHGLR